MYYPLSYLFKILFLCVYDPPCRHCIFRHDVHSVFFHTRRIPYKELTTSWTIREQTHNWRMNECDAWMIWSHLFDLFALNFFDGVKDNILKYRPLSFTPAPYIFKLFKSLLNSLDFFIQNLVSRVLSTKITRVGSRKVNRSTK